jgi:acetyl esterase/lipase
MTPRPDTQAPLEIAKSVGAVQAQEDGLAAIRLVRERARALGIDPHRIGILGFSAGGSVAMNAATAYLADSRPDFVGSVYSALPEGREIPADAPPVFLAVAADDPLLANASAPIFSAWRSLGLSAEIHVFHQAGHGFGMNRKGNSSEHWIDEFYWWMQSIQAVEESPR